MIAKWTKDRGQDTKQSLRAVLSGLKTPVAVCTIYFVFNKLRMIVTASALVASVLELCLLVPECNESLIDDA